MTWITENWIAVLFGVGFIALHLFGHKGHGGGHGGGHNGGHRHRPDTPLPPEPAPTPPGGVPLASGPDAVTDKDARPPAPDAHRH